MRPPRLPASSHSPLTAQSLLLQEMVGAGEAALASDYRQQLGLPESALRIDAGALAAAEAARAEKYLQLSLPPAAVQVVDDVADLPAVSAALAAADAVGVDVEWQPSHQPGRQSPAALLQVRGRGRGRGPGFFGAPFAYRPLGA